ncbi:MAG: hypothetical protein ACKKL5_03640 [Candidatus Komeilibacteria bacterium]
MNNTNWTSKSIALFIIAGLIVLALFTLWGYNWGYRNGLASGQDIINKYQGDLGYDQDKNNVSPPTNDPNSPTTGVPLPPLDNQQPATSAPNQNNNSVPTPPIE